MIWLFHPGLDEMWKPRGLCSPSQAHWDIICISRIKRIWNITMLHLFLLNSAFHSFLSYFIYVIYFIVSHFILLYFYRFYHMNTLLVFKAENISTQVAKGGIGNLISASISFITGTACQCSSLLRFNIQGIQTGPVEFFHRTKPNAWNTKPQKTTTLTSLSSQAHLSYIR